MNVSSSGQSTSGALAVGMTASCRIVGVPDATGSGDGEMLRHALEAPVAPSATITAATRPRRPQENDSRDGGGRREDMSTATDSAHRSLGVQGKAACRSTFQAMPARARILGADGEAQKVR